MFIQKETSNKKELSMKKTLSNNILKILVGTVLVALPFAFGGCEKDPVKPENKKHNVELVYENIEQDLPISTISEYNSNESVDTIFMVPKRNTQYSTTPTNGLKIVVNKLRERHNVNPTKVFGKGELQLKAESIINNPEIVRFFADTLRYNVTSR